MFKVKSKNNPGVTHTVYTVIPCGTLTYFLVFINNNFTLILSDEFVPAE
ncbi:MAG: hypothetical protein IJD78_04350 [Clostridia bacterium]|nr:hypothetical protein [Clostridia bacterium]